MTSAVWSRANHRPIIDRQIRSAGRLKAANDVKWVDYYPLVLAAARHGNLDVVILLQKNFLQSTDSVPALDMIRVAKTPNMSAAWNLILADINDTLMVSFNCFHHISIFCIGFCIVHCIFLGSPILYSSSLIYVSLSLSAMPPRRRRKWRNCWAIGEPPATFPTPTSQLR